MKYIHPSLEEVVPVKLRKELYEKALKWDKLHNHGICLALPMFLWGLKSHLDNIPGSDEYWSYHDTQIAFPELTEERLDRIADLADYPNEQEEMRIKVLTEMIEELN